MYANGRIPASALAAIPGGRLRRDAAYAWNALLLDARRRRLPIPQPAGPVSSYRPLAAQLHFWALYRAGQGNPAAVPGTSNHGWGVAVDVAPPAAWSTMQKLGPHYGFTHEEGARVGEGWHWSNPHGPAARFPRPTVRDPLEPLTPTERRWALELRRLQGDHRDPRRRRQLRRALVRARKRAYHELQRSPSPRARRHYALLHHLTT